MKKKQFKFIFDMDGTLYPFAVHDKTFESSRFHAALEQNVLTFFDKKLGLTGEFAQKELERLRDVYNGETSIGIETEYGIDRYIYFAETWNLQPEEFVQRNDALAAILADVRGNAALLTGAPNIWAEKVLVYLGVSDIFHGKMYTGEPNERKPHPIIFEKIAKEFSVDPTMVISVGDQEHTDIVPAKKLGMKTIRIGDAKESQADFVAKDITEVMKLLRTEGFL